MGKKRYGKVAFFTSNIFAVHKSRGEVSSIERDTNECVYLADLEFIF